MSLLLYTGLLALVGIERLVELRLSARHAAWAFAQGAQEYGQAHYRFMTIFHSGFLVACVAEPWLWQRPFLVPWSWLALGFAVFAQALRYWAITTLGPRWNTRIIVLPGAAPVIGGPYRFVRHPNYVAVVVELVALPLVHGAYVTAVVATIINAGLLWVRIRAEEAALGGRWAAHFAATPRWMPTTGARKKA